MKVKDKITEDNYKEVVLKRSIIICWVLLAICLVIKLFGGNFFGIMCESDNFISFCKFCDDSFVKYILYFLYFMFESVMLLAILKPDIFKYKLRVVLYVIFATLFWCFKILSELRIVVLPLWLSTPITLCYLFVLLSLISKKWWQSLIVIALDTVFISMATYTKNLCFAGYLTDSFLITTIFMVDYYIMLILTHLYSKKIMLKKGG